jgi:hypothetical protein
MPLYELVTAKPVFLMSPLRPRVIPSRAALVPVSSVECRTTAPRPMFAINELGLPMMS